MCANHRFLRRQIIKLVEARGKLPNSLFISGVHRIGDNPIGGGGFADIWQGTTDDKAGIVALKVLRIFDGSQRVESVLKVCHPSSFRLMACSRISTVIAGIL